MANDPESFIEVNVWKTQLQRTNVIKLTFQKIDYIYMTGDIVDHGVWDTSIPKNTESIKKVLTALKMEFPNTPVYPILGNHEATPTNL
jgi:predicted MPP superfamily phosphohydrolase